MILLEGDGLQSCRYKIKVWVDRYEDGELRYNLEAEASWTSPTSFSHNIGGNFTYNCRFERDFYHEVYQFLRTYRAKGMETICIARGVIDLAKLEFEEIEKGV